MRAPRLTALVGNIEGARQGVGVLRPAGLFSPAAAPTDTAVPDVVMSPLPQQRAAGTVIRTVEEPERPAPAPDLPPPPLRSNASQTRSKTPDEPRVTASTKVAPAVTKPAPTGVARPGPGALPNPRPAAETAKREIASAPRPARTSRVLPVTVPQWVPDNTPVPGRHLPPPAASPNLPSDPERLRATAERLGVKPPSAERVPVQETDGQAIGKGVATRAPMTSPARRVDQVAHAVVRETARMDGPRAAPTDQPEPQPRLAQVEHMQPPQPPTLKPAGKSGPALPKLPPAATPQIRIRIGALNIIAPRGKDRHEPARKALPGPALTRAARGHSIPRPDGG